MKWLKFLAVVGALAAGLYIYYQWAFPVYSYRIRVTIEVDDNGKTYSGSGIIQSSWQNAPNWVPVEKHWTGWHTGEAPFVDVGDKGTLLAAFGPWTPSLCKPTPKGLPSLPLIAFLGATKGHPMVYKEGFVKLQRSTGRREIAPENMPEFVWLPKPSDRSSAKIVCPQDFGSVIAPGVRLTSVFVEITEDQPDGSIFRKFPWLAKLKTDPMSPYLHTDSKNFELNACDLLGAS